jgi:hypothetical protein
MNDGINTIRCLLSWHGRSERNWSRTLVSQAVETHSQYALATFIRFAFATTWPEKIRCAGGRFGGMSPHGFQCETFWIILHRVGSGETHLISSVDLVTNVHI